MIDESSGLPYYYHTKTGQTVWERPQAFVIPLAVLQVSPSPRRSTPLPNATLSRTCTYSTSNLRTPPSPAVCRSQIAFPLSDRRRPRILVSITQRTAARVPTKTNGTSVGPAFHLLCILNQALDGARSRLLAQTLRVHRLLFHTSALASSRSKFYVGLPQARSTV